MNPLYLLTSAKAASDNAKALEAFVNAYRYEAIKQEALGFYLDILRDYFKQKIEEDSEDPSVVDRLRIENRNLIEFLKDLAEKLRQAYPYVEALRKLIPKLREEPDKYADVVFDLIKTAKEENPAYKELLHLPKSQENTEKILKIIEDTSIQNARLWPALSRVATKIGEDIANEKGTIKDPYVLLSIMVILLTLEMSKISVAIDELLALGIQLPKHHVALYDNLISRTDNLWSKVWEIESQVLDLKFRMDDVNRELYDVSSGLRRVSIEAEIARSTAYGASIDAAIAKGRTGG